MWSFIEKIICKLNNPLVSIIIPVYNTEKYLEETIYSAINQTWPNKEIIIVDDGSVDNSLSIAKGFESKIVKVFSQKNKGASSARNRGLKEANGEYIQFLDADDILSPDKIEAQINCLNGSTTHLATCSTIHFNEKEDFLKGTVIKAWFNAGSDDPIDFLIKLHAGEEVMPGYGGMISTNSWLTPYKIIEKAGPWNEDLTVDDDGEFFCRVVLASSGIIFSEQGIDYYRKFIAKKTLSGQKTKAGIASAIRSIDLKYEYLKSKTNSNLVDLVFAKHYWWTGVLAFPQFKSYSEYCIKKGAELGYKGKKYIGGPSGQFISKYFGWRVARFFSYYQELLKS